VLQCETVDQYEILQQVFGAEAITKIIRSFRLHIRDSRGFLSRLIPLSTEARQQSALSLGLYVVLAEDAVKSALGPIRKHQVPTWLK